MYTDLFAELVTYMHVVIIDIYVDADKIDFLAQMTVIAKDFGTPKLQTSQALLVDINVIRNNFAPVFANQVVSRSISQNSQQGSSVFNVQATDADTRVSLLMCHVLNLTLIGLYLIRVVQYC